MSRLSLIVRERVGPGVSSASNAVKLTTYVPSGTCVRPLLMSQSKVAEVELELPWMTPSTANLMATVSGSAWTLNSMEPEGGSVVISVPPGFCEMISERGARRARLVVHEPGLLDALRHPRVVHSTLTVTRL